MSDSPSFVIKKYVLEIDGREIKKYDFRIVRTAGIFLQRPTLYCAGLAFKFQPYRTTRYKVIVRALS